MRILAPTVTALSLVLGFPVLRAQAPAAAQTPSRIALTNGQWFNGSGFEARTMYSVDGRFTATQPARIDSTLDLAGTWIVPPFGEAHNHNIDGAVEERSRQALRRYVADGVFYVKIQGTIDSEADLDAKWAQVLALRPDFLKINLWSAEEFERRKTDAKYFGMKGLDPALLPGIVARARQQRLRVSAHISNAADFHVAATLGVFDALSLLRMWAETTPQAIFPERRIGLLRDGYEASFLALGGNPLEDSGNVRRIKLRFKQGILLP